VSALHLINSLWCTAKQELHIISKEPLERTVNGRPKHHMYVKKGKSQISGRWC